MHWRADHLVMWRSPVSHQDVLDATRYYATTIGTHPAKYAHVHVGLCTFQAALLLAKMVVGREINWLFDGASLFLILSTALLYQTTLLPCTSRNSPVITSLTGQVVSPVLATAEFNTALAKLRDVSNAHLLVSMALVGIIFLQCGKYYSERLQERERNEEVDLRLVRRLRQLQQEARERNGEQALTAAPSVGGPGAST